MNSFLNLWKKYSYLILMLFLIAGLFDFRIGLIATICMFAPIIVSFFKGRFWCGNICPRGSFYDNFVSKFANKKKTPKFLKTVYFRIAITALMLTVFTTGMIKNWGNLYGMGVVVYRLIVVTTIIGLILAFFYNERTWCNFCPMGIAPYEYKDDSISHHDCIQCSRCVYKCPKKSIEY